MSAITKTIAAITHDVNELISNNKGHFFSSSNDLQVIVKYEIIDLLYDHDWEDDLKYDLANDLANDLAHFDDEPLTEDHVRTCLLSNMKLLASAGGCVCGVIGNVHDFGCPERKA